MEGVQCQVIGHGHRIHGWDDDWMVYRGFHLFTEHIEVQV